MGRERQPAESVTRRACQARFFRASGAYSRVHVVQTSGTGEPPTLARFHWKKKLENSRQNAREEYNRGEGAADKWAGTRSLAVQLTARGRVRMLEDSTGSKGISWETRNETKSYGRLSGRWKGNLIDSSARPTTICHLTLSLRVPNIHHLLE